MKRITLAAFCMLALQSSYAQKVYKLLSPDQKIEMNISLSDQIRYDIISQGDTLLTQCNMQMTVDNASLGKNPRVTKVSRNSVDETLTPVVPLKFSSVANQYNQLLLKFKGGYSVEFRAFDNGVAYRFITNLKDSIDVKDESFCIHFPANYLLHMQQPGSFKTSYEEEYRQR